MRNWCCTSSILLRRHEIPSSSWHTTFRGSFRPLDCKRQSCYLLQTDGNRQGQTPIAWILVQARYITVFIIYAFNSPCKSTHLSSIMSTHQVERIAADRPPPPAVVTSISFRMRPILLVFTDLKLTFTNVSRLLTLLSHVFPPPPANKLSELYLRDFRNTLALTEQIMLMFVTFIALVLLPFLPLLVSVALVGCSSLFTNYVHGATIINPWQERGVQSQTEWNGYTR